MVNVVVIYGHDRDITQAQTGQAMAKGLLFKNVFFLVFSVLGHAIFVL